MSMFKSLSHVALMFNLKISHGTIEIRWINKSHLAIISCWEELERGEAVDFDSLNLVGRGVHLSHHDVCVVLVFLSQLIPDRSQLFAMTAPRSIWNKGKQNQDEGKNILRVQSRTDSYCICKHAYRIRRRHSWRHQRQFPRSSSPPGPLLGSCPSPQEYPGS